jgi:hypothetical protein
VNFGVDEGDCANGLVFATVLASEEECESVGVNGFAKGLLPFALLGVPKGEGFGACGMPKGLFTPASGVPKGLLGAGFPLMLRPIVGAVHSPDGFVSGIVGPLDAAKALDVDV